MNRSAVFVSHSTKDQACVADMVRALEAEGLDTFLAPRDMAGGEAWLEALRSNIENSEQLVVCWTEEAARSQWVWIELGMAIALHRPVVPYRPSGEVQLPVGLNHLHAIGDLAELGRWARRIQRESRGKQPEFNSHISEEARSGLYCSRDIVVHAVRLYGSGADIVPASRIDVVYEDVEYRRSSEFTWFEGVIRDRLAMPGGNFFNGPCVRLLEFEAAPAPDQAARELDTLTLRLAPIGWFDYAGINEYLFEKREVIGERAIARWIGLRDLLRELNIVSHTLPMILDTATTILTSDGMLAYQVRSPAGVATRSRNLTSAVAENINRYKDDADPGDYRMLRNGSHGRSSIHIGERYTPVGVPHPLAAVRRGISAELAPAVLRYVEDNSSSGIKCSGISFDLDTFHPDLLCVAAVPLRSDELARVARGEEDGERGTEFREGSLKFMRAEFSDPATRALLADYRRWNPGGHASVFRAIELLTAIRRENRCSHSEALEIIRAE